MEELTMKIYPLGVGGGFTSRFYHNNYLFEEDNKKLLVDAGTTLRYSLRTAQVAVEDIDYLLITHLHFDHVGGLEELLMRRFWTSPKKCRKIEIIIHTEQVIPLKRLLEPSLCNQGLTLNDYCQLRIVKENEPLVAGPFQLNIINTSHLHVPDLPSIAFTIKGLSSKWNILFSGDIKNIWDSQFINFINEETKLIFQDICFKKNNVHASLQEVLSYYPPSIHDKICAMHYEDDIESYVEDIQNGNIQLVQQGVPILIE